MTLKKLLHGAKRHNNTRHHHRRRLHVEPCEPRNLLAVFTVTSELDTGAAGELRWAVNQANGLAGADAILFSDNVTNITLTQGEIPITDDVDINGPLVTPDLITINASANSRIFRINDGTFNDIEVSMGSLHLRGGDVSLAGVSQGGAVLNHEDLTVRNSLVTESVANVGGGIANWSDVSLTNVRMSENEALGTGGGAVWNAPQATIAITGGEIYGNQAYNGSGGGILNDVGAHITITGDAVVSANVAQLEGGGLLLGSGSSGDLQHATIRNNFAASGGGIMVDQATLETNASTEILSNQARRGGGIAVTEFGNATVRGSLISGNWANSDGGGMLVSGFGSATFYGGEVTANQAGALLPADGRGGGFYIADGEVSLNNTLVNYNGAVDALITLEKGGGAFLGLNARLNTNASTFSGNVAFYGGAVYATSASGATSYVDMSGSTIRNNFVYVNGGGIHAGPAVDVELNGVTISNNYAQFGNGGGIVLTNEANNANVVANIRESTITMNTALRGGGVHSSGGVDLTMRGTTVSENSGRFRGGGLLLTGVNTNGLNSTTIHYSRIVDNQTGYGDGTAYHGGGIWSGNGSALSITTSTIAGNTAAGRGGGISVNNNVDFGLFDSTLSGNVADHGAGVALLNTNGLLQQTTFYSNQADYDGGGLWVDSNTTLPSHFVQVRHSTFSLNSAAGGTDGVGRGGGIWIGPANPDLFSVLVSLDHTIVSNNLGAPLGGFDEIFDTGQIFGAPSLSVQYSLIRDNVGTLLAPGNPDPNGNLIGSAASPIDALLGPLTAAGGPTLTMVPSDASPAINAGDPLFIGPPNFDQRQAPFARVFADRIDMGAVEVQPSPPTPDFDGDGDADCDDVNALTTVIASGLYSPLFDLNGDGAVNGEDLDQWLDDAPDVNGIGVDAYLPADANLDLIVDGLDFIIWNIHKFTNNSNFCDGDFNADGVVDGLDFIIWNTYKFQASSVAPTIGASPGALLVPETADETASISAARVTLGVDSVMANLGSALPEVSLAQDRVQSESATPSVRAWLGDSTTDNFEKQDELREQMDAYWLDNSL